MLPSAPHATVLEVSIEEAQNDEQVAVEMVDEEEKAYQVVFTFQAGRSPLKHFSSADDAFNHCDEV